MNDEGKKDMKLIHLSDLHLGKRLNEFSLIEDQKYILTKIINVIDGEKPDAILIAGDIYDKSVPSAEAVELFDDFVVRLAKRSLQVFVISGNHDSAERLAFGNRLMDRSGIHFSPVYNGEIMPLTLSDEYGEVKIYMLPFIKPAHVRRFYPEERIETYTDAIRIAIGNMQVPGDSRNILITHQFVTGASRTESEEISVGGSDNVDASVFDKFDYVALGHIHRPQNIGSEKIRYCGTPLKYSFSEANDRKSVSIVEIGANGAVSIRETPLAPLRDMVELKGKYEELMLKSFYEGKTYQEDYTYITLTDEEDIPDALAKLRVVYHNLMKLDYDNARTRHRVEIGAAEDVETKSPLQLFSEFYLKQNGVEMNHEETEFMCSLIEKVWESRQ